MREVGYYWVKLEGIWTIAMWHIEECNGLREGYWNWFVDNRYEDKDFNEIDERMIVRE